MKLIATIALPALVLANVPAYIPIDQTGDGYLSYTCDFDFARRTNGLTVNDVPLCYPDAPIPCSAGQFCKGSSHYAAVDQCGYTGTGPRINRRMLYKCDTS